MILGETPLAGAFVVELEQLRDERGHFARTFDTEQFAAAGLDGRVAQCNTSFNAHAGTLRGMHYQADPHGEAKLIRATRGAIFDVLVDIRRGSPAFSEWEAFELTDSNHHQLYCPDGFAHGFCVLSEEADVVYKTSAYYDPELERGFAYNDPEVGIEWPGGAELIASQRDQSAPSLAEIAASLPFEYAG